MVHFITPIGPETITEVHFGMSDAVVGEGCEDFGIKKNFLRIRECPVRKGLGLV